MTSLNGNIFCVTGHLCGEFTGPGEFVTQRPVTRRLMFVLICARMNSWVNNGEAGDLGRNRAHYDVTVMKTARTGYRLASQFDCDVCIEETGFTKLNAVPKRTLFKTLLAACFQSFPYIQICPTIDVYTFIISIKATTTDLIHERFIPIIILPICMEN